MFNHRNQIIACATIPASVAWHKPLKWEVCCAEGGGEYHAVISDRALCKRSGGRRRARWASIYGNAVTCPRCLAALEKLPPEARPQTYALTCKDFGRRFTFQALGPKDAEDKVRAWARYHSHTIDGYVLPVPLAQPSEVQDLHNDFIPSRL